MNSKALRWTILDVDPILLVHIVDGRNPKQPPGMFKTMYIMGHLPYQLLQDFFHQQYHEIESQIKKEFYIPVESKEIRYLSWT